MIMQGKNTYQFFKLDVKYLVCEKYDHEGA
jgi:hypothetical protein